MKSLVAFSIALWSAFALAQSPPVATLQMHEVELTYPAESVVEAIRQATVAAQIPGRIVDVRIDAGRRVKAGELLMRIDAREVAEVVIGTEALLAQAKANFERTQNLSKEGVVAPQELDQARNTRDASQARLEGLKKQVDAQRAAVALARSNAEQVAVRRSQLANNEHQRAAANAQLAKAGVRLAYTEVKAPIDGFVDTKAARVGEVVSAGQPLVTLIDPDDLLVRADVEETYIDRVRIGDILTVRLPSGVERPGKIFYRGADAAFATQRDVSRTKRDIKTFEVRLRVDNSDRRLAVGMTAYVLLPIGDR